MEAATFRDVIIIIYFTLGIILTIGIGILAIVLYRKINSIMESGRKSVVKVHRWIAYVNGMAKGLNQSASIFRRGG